MLVLGSGIAGLSYAIKAAARREVLVLTKKDDSEANTNYAQGGIAAVMDPGDSFAAHIQDTLDAGAGLCHEDAVRLLVENGPDRVRDLMGYGVAFTYRGDDPGRLSLAREGGHSARRIVRADDLTGRAIEKGLLAAAAKAGVEVLEHWYALDLWTTGEGADRRCVGALVVDRYSGELVAVRAQVTFLATGGSGQVYRYTTNPAIATGDGLAMAWRVGAPVANLEFVQFHPTALYPVTDEPFLISEAVRGEGAVLRDHEGREIMRDRPAGDLSPRDVVARAIDAEMRASDRPHVWLDCGPIPADHFAERFPNILDTCRRRGYDPLAEWLPVVPAAHYQCGGITTDLEARAVAPRGLLAAGEVACAGVHGANRLASNSLLEAVVFADRAAETTRRLLDELPPGDVHRPPIRRPRRGGDPEALREQVRDILWTGAGIVRSDAGLAEAARALRRLAPDVPFEPVDPAAAEAANLYLVGSLIVASATLRKESRGLHFTVSHPEPDPAYRRDTILVPGEHPLEGA